MEIKLRLPCPTCQEEMQDAANQPDVETKQGPLVRFCPHNNAAIAVWIDRGTVFGWEVFSAWSLEQALDRVETQIKGAVLLRSARLRAHTAEKGGEGQPSEKH